MEGALEDSIVVIKLLIQDNVIILNDKHESKEFQLKALVQQIPLDLEIKEIYGKDSDSNSSRF